jgi:hypothetical protein
MVGFVPEVAEEGGNDGIVQLPAGVAAKGNLAGWVRAEIAGCVRHGKVA